MRNHTRTHLLITLILSGAAGYGLVRALRPPVRENMAREAAAHRPAAARSETAPPASGKGSGTAFAEARDFLTRLEAAGLEDLPALWAALDSEKPEEGGAAGPDLRRMMVMERWAELDAPGALAFAKSQQETDPKLMVTGVFSVWGQTAPEEAMKAVKEETDRTLQAAAAVGWLRSASEDPVAFVDHASQLTWLDVSGLDKAVFLEQVPQAFLENLHNAVPERLKKLVSWMPPWFKEMLETLDWRKSLRDHPDQALAALESMPLTRDKLEGMLSALTPLAKTRPERVAEVLSGLANRPGEKLFEMMSWNGQRQLMEALITTLGPEQPERVGRLLADTRGSIAGAEILADTLLRTDPAAALRVAPSLSNIDQLAELLFPPLPAMDPATALELAKNAPASYYRDRIMDDALLNLNRQNPDAARDWIAGLPEGEVRDSARRTLDLASASPNARLLERVGHQLSAESGDMSGEAQKRLQLLSAMAAWDDPQGTREKVSAWPEGAARDTALQALGALAASNEDPSEAVQWAASLPEETQRSAAYAGAVKGWTQTNPVAASEWVAGLSDGPVREAAVGSFAAEITNRDPEAGLEWAATLTHPDNRLRRLREVVDLWKTKDAPAAKEAVLNFPGLSGDDRSTLLRSLP